MSKELPAPSPSELVPTVQPKVAKDLAGNYVYYLPDKSVPETTEAADSATVKCSTPTPAVTPHHVMEQVITLSPVKGGAANVVTINSENILGRIDIDTLNSLNQLLDEVTETSDSSVKTSKEEVNTEDILTVESTSYSSDPVAGSIYVMSAGMQTRISLPAVGSSMLSAKPSAQDPPVSSNSMVGDLNSNCGLVSPVSSLSVTECVSSVDFGIPVTVSQGNTTPVSHSHPSVVSTITDNPNGNGTVVLSITESVNHCVVTPEISENELAHNQESFSDPTKNSVFSVPSNLTSGILTSVSHTIDQSVLESPVISVNEDLRTEALRIPQNYSEPHLQGTANLLSEPQLQGTANQLSQPHLQGTANQLSQPHLQGTANQLSQPLLQGTANLLSQPHLQGTANQLSQPHLQGTANQLSQPHLQGTANQLSQPHLQGTANQLSEPHLQGTANQLSQPHLQGTANQLSQPHLQGTANQLSQPHLQGTANQLSQPHLQGTASELSVLQTVAQNTVLPPFQSLQSNVALSTYQPVQVFSTPSSQYQQSIMSTPKQLPQTNRNVSATPRNLYVDLNQPAGDNGQPQVFQQDARCVVPQDARCIVPQILTDVNMNTIQQQQQLSDIPTVYTEQAKLVSPSVQTYSKNGYLPHAGGLPLLSVSNQGSLYDINTAQFTPSRPSLPYPANLAQSHAAGVGPSLLPAVSPVKNTYRTSLYKPSSNGSFYRNGSFLSSTAPNPGHGALPRHAQQFVSLRPPSNTPSYSSDSYTVYLNSDGLQTNQAKSEPSGCPSLPRKLMPKRQMLQVKKHVSIYWPDFSNYPEVCICDKLDLGSEIHIEQIWLHMQQMYYLPQIHILVIGCDEFVGILRDKKYFISVREIMLRLIPKFQKEVRTYLSDMKCDMDLMTLEELAYLKQRGCIDSDVHDLISLGSLRELCRCLLNRHSRLDSETNKLTEAATGIYYRKILEKHTRCSKCGGARKCCDNLDRYEAIDCPVGITYKEQKMALRQREVIESAFNKKTSSPRNSQQTVVKSERMKIGRLLVGGTQFNTFKIKDKCFISLKELVSFKLSTLQVLQSRLVNLQSRPRPAPSCVDKYFVMNNIPVHNTLWIDTVIVRCMCCLGHQKTQMLLQKYFKCGEFEEIWDKEIDGLDDGEVNGVVFTLNPSTVTISSKRCLPKTAKPVPESPGRTSITMGPGTKPVAMRSLSETVLKMPNGNVRFTTKPAHRENQFRVKRSYNRKINISERNSLNRSVENESSDVESPVKLSGIVSYASLARSSVGQNLNDQMRESTKLSSENDQMRESAKLNAEMDNMTEESILEMAAREAMLMPEYLNDSDGLEYPTSVDSVIQAIGMEDGLPSEEFVIQEIEKGGLNLFDGVLSSSICGEKVSKNPFDDSFSDGQADKKHLLLLSPRKSSPFQQTTTNSTETEDLPGIKRRAEIRKKRVPKRYEEFFNNTVHTVVPTKKDKKKGNTLCTAIKHNGKTLKQKNKGSKSQSVSQVPVYRNGGKEEKSEILNVIKHCDIENITKRNQEIKPPASPVSDNEEIVKDGDFKNKEMDNGERLCGFDQNQNFDFSVTPCEIVTASNGENVDCEETNSIEQINSKEKSPKVVIENNIESLCTPIKKLDNNSNTSSPNGSFSSPLSDEVKSSRIQRVYDKVAALESSQDEYRILHMLATVAEVVTESGDEHCDQNTGSDEQANESHDLHTEITEHCAKCDINVKSSDSMEKVPNQDASLTIQCNNITEMEISSDDKEGRSCDIDDQSGARAGLTDVEELSDPVKRTGDSKDSVPELFCTLISEEEYSDDDITSVPSQCNLPGCDPGVELQERVLKFISAVNRYVDVIESQREAGIQTYRIRFLKGAEQAFPGLYRCNGIQRRKSFAVLLNRILYHQDGLLKQSMEDTVGKSGSEKRSASRNSSVNKTAKRKKLCWFVF